MGRGQASLFMSLGVINKMKLTAADFTILYCLIWIISFETVEAFTRLCSQCNSYQNPRCEEKAPEPMPCVESPGPASCKIVRKKLNGRQIEFARACSTVKEGESAVRGCIDSDITNITSCYELCFSDGCNSRGSEIVFHAGILLVCSCLAFFLAMYL